MDLGLHGRGRCGAVLGVAVALALVAGCEARDGLTWDVIAPAPTDGGGTFDGGRGVGGTTGIGIACGGTGNAPLAGSTGSGGRGMRPATPTIGPTVTQAIAPPAVSGGTMRVLADGVTVVAADPDRDQVYVVDLATRSLRATVTLQPGDEPGRVIADGAGRVHVALRRGGAVVTVDPVGGTVLARRSVCAAPRGLAYDPAVDLLHVACAGGELVSLPAGGGAAVRTLQLDRDLRDVVVDGPRLRVSRFRSAEMLSIEADGSISGRVVPPLFATASARDGQRFSPSVAYQMVGAPDGSVVMLHQRGVIDTVHGSAGGYGDANPCSAVVHPAVTVVTPTGEVKTGPPLSGMALVVDVAISGDGARVAFVAAGNAHNQPLGGLVPARVFVSALNNVSDTTMGCPSQGVGSPGACPRTAPVPPLAADGGITGTATDAGTANDGGTPTLGLCNSPDVAIPQVVGEPIAVAFAGVAGNRTLIVQSREPALLALGDGTSIPLSSQSRADTGHLVFHANAGKGVACASCHAEGNDDGRVWNFDCGGARRTQSLHTGLRGTEPFHWSGDEADFSRLMTDVFVGRMSGPPLVVDQMETLLSWIDYQPRPPAAAPRDLTAVERGKALFEDTKSAGCVTCHAGARFSNNATADVGTGAPFQVPSLLGIGSRGPFMHNGCAATLKDRFSPACGGGDLHGVTSGLSQPQISDLIAYLESL